MSDQMTLEEMEAATAAAEAALAKIKGPKKVAPQRDPAPRRKKDGETLKEIQESTRVKNATFKYGHSGFAGPSLIERIQEQMDKRRKALAKMIIDQGSAVRTSEEYILNKGRYEGFAATLAILRSSSLKNEIALSNERLGIE